MTPSEYILTIPSIKERLKEDLLDFYDSLESINGLEYSNVDYYNIDIAIKDNIYTIEFEIKFTCFTGSGATALYGVDEIILSIYKGNIEIYNFSLEYINNIVEEEFLKLILNEIIKDINKEK